jgi:hypothetical protein
MCEPLTKLQTKASRSGLVCSNYDTQNQKIQNSVVIVEKISTQFALIAGNLVLWILHSVITVDFFTIRPFRIQFRASIKNH